MNLKLLLEIFSIVWGIYKYLSDNKIDPQTYLKETQDAFDKLKGAKDSQEKFDALDRISDLLKRV